MTAIRVRRAHTLDDLATVSRLQASIWQSQDMAAPASVLRALDDAGGIVLLATRDGEPVGFCFGFTGRTRDGRSYHRSHAMGVVPALRDAGVGRRLKLAQRRAALALGLDRIVWTFDPVQTRNAHLNLHRLGAVARAYRRDYYGARRDAFNGGLPSDRLVAEWFVGGRHPGILATLRAGRPGPGGLTRVRVPRDLRGQAATDPAGAARAHRRLRRRLVALLGQGLAAVDFDAASTSYVLASLPAGLPPPV